MWNFFNICNYNKRVKEYNFLVDGNGNFLTDINTNFQIVES